MFKIIATRRQRGKRGIMNDIERRLELSDDFVTVTFDPFT
jgi:hypothetical protein